MNSKFKITDELGRLDKFLATQLPQFSRAHLQNCIKARKVFVNGKAVKANYSLQIGDEIECRDIEIDELSFLPEAFSLDIVHDSKTFMVIDKPADMVVHPGESGSHLGGTVANQVASVVDKGVGQPRRPGIVHRLDQETSGLLLIAKTLSAYDYFIAMFKNREIEKRYMTLVAGIVDPVSGVVDAPIARDLKNRKQMSIADERTGKKAISIYKTVDNFELDNKEFSLLDVEIKTGRTHQIRVHLKAIGYPIVGDKVYGSRSANRFVAERFGLKRQFLHASELKFLCPDTKKQLTIRSELPADLNSVVEGLN